MIHTLPGLKAVHCYAKIALITKEINMDDVCPEAISFHQELSTTGTEHLE